MNVTSKIGFAVIPSEARNLLVALGKKTKTPTPDQIFRFTNPAPSGIQKAGLHFVTIKIIVTSFRMTMMWYFLVRSNRF